jgi:hypothetical protein
MKKVNESIMEETHGRRSWKVMEGYGRNSWKVIEGHGRSWKVMEGMIRR